MTGLLLQTFHLGIKQGLPITNDSKSDPILQGDKAMAQTPFNVSVHLGKYFFKLTHRMFFAEFRSFDTKITI